MFAGQYKMFGPYNDTNLNEMVAPNVVFNNSQPLCIWSYINGKYWMVPLNRKGSESDPGLHVYWGGVFSPTCPPNGGSYVTQIKVNYRVHWGRLTSTTVPYVGTTYTRTWTLQCNLADQISNTTWARTTKRVGTPDHKVAIYSAGTTYFDVYSGTMSNNNNIFILNESTALKFSINNQYGQRHPTVWEQELTSAPVLFAAGTSSTTRDFFTDAQARVWQFTTPNDFGLNYR